MKDLAPASQRDACPVHLIYLGAAVDEVPIKYEQRFPGVKPSISREDKK